MTILFLIIFVVHNTRTLNHTTITDFNTTNQYDIEFVCGVPTSPNFAHWVGTLVIIELDG